MKLITTLLPLCLSSLVASNSFFGKDQHVLADDHSVDGDNPLHFCQDPKDYSLDIEYVNLIPNPPEP